MNANLVKMKKKRGPGRPPKHGGFTFMDTGVLPENRRYVRAYLTDFREGIVSDLGPTEADLTAAQVVLIDRAVSLLGILRCMEEHVREASVFEGAELAPCLRSHYISYSNSLRLTLRELGIDKRATDDALDLRSYLASKEMGGAEDE